MESAPKIGITQTIVPLLQEMLEEDERIMSQMRHRLQRNMITDSSTMVAWLLCRHIFSISGSKNRGTSLVKSLLELSDKKFIEQLNISKPVFHTLVKVCIKKISGDSKKLFSVQFNVVVTLWYLTKEEPISVIATRFGIDSRKVLLIVTQICESVATAAGQYMSLTAGEGKPTFLFEEGKMQIILGVLNSIHIPVKGRDISKSEDYINKNGTRTIIAQLVVRPNGSIVDCFASCPGKMTNAEVLAQSGLASKVEQLQNSEEARIIADLTYSLRPWLLTPFPKTDAELPTHEEKYNSLLQSASEVFSVTTTNLVGRFQRLKHLEVESADAAGVYVVACSIIHNMCLQGRVGYEMPEFEISLATGEVNGGIDSVSDDSDAVLFRQNLATTISG